MLEECRFDLCIFCCLDIIAECIDCISVCSIHRILTAILTVPRILTVRCDNTQFDGGLWYGGLDALRHYLLRLIAVWLGYMPRRYAHFLEHCSKLVFLRSVGGGYIFIHRMLLEHFAAMWEGEEKERGHSASVGSGSAVAAPT